MYVYTLVLLCFLYAWYHHSYQLKLVVHMSNMDYVFEEYPVHKNEYQLTSSIFKTFTQYRYRDVYSQAVQLQKFFGVNKTVYGIKKSNDVFSFEFYYYYPNENPLHTVTNICKFLNLPEIEEPRDYYLVSFDADSTSNLNLYYTINECTHNSPRDYHSHTVCETCKLTRNVTYNVDTGTTTRKNVYKFFYKRDTIHEELFEYTRSLLQRDVDMSLLFPKYLMNFKKSVCISSKPGGTIGLYFSLIPWEDFKTFISETKFSETLDIKKSTTLFDVGIDLKVIDFNHVEITKVAFYGIF